MPKPSHHPSGPLAVAITLAAAAGFVDAHIYLTLTPVFVANMSGNLIHLGVWVGDGSWRAAAAAMVTLVAFTSGVIFGTMHHDRHLARSREAQPTFLLGVEAILLAGLTAWMTLAPTPFTQNPGPADYPALLVGGLAMGLQAAALRRVGDVAVATTYGTGAIVRIGEKLVLAARRADRTTDDRRRVTIMVLAVVLASYVMGAVIATISGRSALLLLLPSAAIAGCALAGERHTRPDAPAPASGISP